MIALFVLKWKKIEANFAKMKIKKKQRGQPIENWNSNLKIKKKRIMWLDWRRT